MQLYRRCCREWGCRLAPPIEINGLLRIFEPAIVSSGAGKVGREGQSKEGLSLFHFGLVAIIAGMGFEHTEAPGGKMCLTIFHSAHAFPLFCRGR